MITPRTGITVKFLALGAILGIGLFSAMVLWGCSGCSRTTAEYSNTEGLWGTGMRPALGDTTRVLRNAHYLKMMGRPELALRELEAAHQEDPRNLRVLDTLARTYEEVGEFDRAQKLYLQALTLDPSNQALNNNLCFSYYLTGQYEKAETCFRQALAKNPQNLTVRNNLGLLLCRLGRSEEAHRLWQETEGEMAAQKKMQQVMVALGQGEQSHYAQSSPPRPIQDRTPATAAAPAKVKDPVKLAANSAPGPLPSRKEPAAAVNAKKTAAAQPQKPSPGIKATSASPSPGPLSIPGPVAVRKKAPAKAPVAAQPPEPEPPLPPRRVGAVKKAAPAATPPPKPVKTRMAAAPAKLAPSGIEVANGSGAYKLAHETRSILKAEGFKVVQIGNYRDFGVENTVIYYRPGSEEVARTLSAKFFPKSKLEIGEGFARGADIKIILGRDAATPATVASEPESAAEKIAAVVGAGRPELKPAAPAPVAAQAKAPAPAPLPAKAVVTAQAAPRATLQHPYLTADELETMAVEIRNGSGAKDLAHRARAILSQEGFNVTRIGNHIDFGAEKTVIYYRPGAEKMARNLNTRFFPHSQLEQSAKLQGDVAVKVLLGKDLLQHTNVMAKLSD